MSSEFNGRLARCSRCDLRRGVTCSVSGLQLHEHMQSGACPHPQGTRFTLPIPPPAPPKPIQPIPRAEWPRTVRAIAGRRQPNEAGVGTTLTRLLAGVGGEVYKRWFKKIVGKSCGCSDRAARLDQLYPHEP